MTERPLIVIDLDNTFVDYTTAFKECLTQMGYDGYADAPNNPAWGWRSTIGCRCPR